MLTLTLPMSKGMPCTSWIQRWYDIFATGIHNISSVFLPIRGEGCLISYRGVCIRIPLVRSPYVSRRISLIGIHDSSTLSMHVLHYSRRPTWPRGHSTHGCMLWEKNESRQNGGDGGYGAALPLIPEWAFIYNGESLNIVNVTLQSRWSEKRFIWLEWETLICV